MQKLDIDPKQWVELNQLLDIALDLPVAERDAWLAALAPQHSALKPQLIELLRGAARVETHDFLNTLPKVAVEEVGAGEQPGTPVGPYRLVRELGIGGMGSVWLAERTDGLMSRHVALKLPHVASHRVGLAERMAREREILGGLTHPNIARLYDAGITPEGRPYLAIEYVEGARIDEYCERRALDTRARLRLFLQIANAVAYAHAQLVIHRDLKPANILVTEAGDVRLLDFGVAKLLDAGRAASTELTELAGRALTLDYASPEQIGGQPLTIATDVYSLGVVLYELLTGLRPYKLKRDSRGALEDAILQTDPTRPSEAAAPEAKRLLRGDLDQIVLKALKKAPDERYTTVNAFAEDVARFLDNKPVLAQPDRWAYRLRKLASRHRAAVAVSLLVAAVLAAGVATIVWQARVATAERDRAVDTQRFIVSLFQDVDPFLSQRHQSLTANELLDRAQQRIDTELADRPDMRAELQSVLAQSYSGLSNFTRAAEAAEKALTEMRGLRSPDRAQIAAMLLARAEALKNVERFHDAEKSLTELFALHSAQPLSNDVWAQAKITESSLHMQRQAYDKSLASAHEVIDFDKSGAAVSGIVVGRAMMMSANATGMMGKKQEAIELQRQAYEHLLESTGNNHRHPDVIEAEQTYGIQLLATDYARAAPYIERSLESARAMYGPDSLIVAHFATRAAQIALERGQLSKARELLLDAERIAKEVGEGSAMVRVGRLRTLGRTLIAMRRDQEALVHLDHAMRMGEEIQWKPILPMLAADRAFARWGSGQEEAARELTDLQATSQQGPPQHLLPMYLAHALPTASVAKRLELLESSVTSARSQSRRSELADALIRLASAKLDGGRAGEAQQHVDEALKILSDVHVAMTPARAEASLVQGRIFISQNRAADALIELAKADDFWRSFDADNRWAGETALTLARSLAAVGSQEESAAALARARSILARSPLNSDRSLAQLAR